MSLNGLEDVKVKEAYEAAAAEPGGWFLLKYVSRDEVDLLGRGNGGIVEIRNTIAGYEEPSPLFGFLRYRRRNVIIKYVPEECSRLVQARVTVHFNAVTERFSPHDTVFSITTAKELRDTKLSAACSLHTASGSISSSTSSLRRRRLMEIAEDAEEDDRAKRQSTVPEERAPTEKALSISEAPATEPVFVQPQDPTFGLPSQISGIMAADGESLRPPLREASGSEVRSRSPAKSVDEPRRSFQSGSPELYSHLSYGSNGKPKVKLGPRPSLDVVGRSHSSSASQYRPISQLPAGIKSFSKALKKEQNGLDSLQSSETPSMTISKPPLGEPETHLNSPETPLVRPHTSGGRSTKGSNTVTKPFVSSNNSTPKTPMIKPEKARLLKALELRKKQMSAISPSEPPALTPNGLRSPSIMEERPLSRSSDETHRTQNDAGSLNDSGIAFDASSTLKTDESDATRSDSYPVSPIGPSEPAESTRASSISESTDETIQEPHVTKNDTPIVEQTRDESGSELTQGNSQDIDAANESISAIELPFNGSTPNTGVEAEPPSISNIRDSHDPASENAIVVELAHLSPVAYKPPTSPSFEPQNAVVVVSDRSVDALQERPIENGANNAASDQVEESTIDARVPDLAITTPNAEDKALSRSPRRLTGSPEIKECNVPRSKFSVQNLRAQDMPRSTNNAVEEVMPKPSVEDVFLGIDGNRSSMEGDRIGEAPRIRKKKQRGLVEPIRTDIDLSDMSAANSEANFSSDDDLMDELQSAVFQEAKPISVSKSPISPVFPSPKKRGDENARFSRTVSTPAGLERSNSQLLPVPANNKEQLRVVSASAAYLNNISKQSAQPLAKKVNLGSGISQRIKALEKFSSSAPGSTPSAAPPSASSPAFFAVSKGSVRGASKSPSIAERANSLTRNNPAPSSRDSSPETLKHRDRSSSIQSRVEAFKSAPIPMSQVNRPQVESISVTARIVRDPAHPFPAKSDAGKDPMDYTPLDLKQSPLVIDHQKAVAAPAKETILERRLSNSSKSGTKERRSSFTIVKDLINERRTSFAERRRSINIEPSVTSPSIKSPSRPPSTHNKRPLSINSRVSISSSRELPSAMSPPPTAMSFSSASDEKGDKKANRASRMLRRMSSTLSTSRKAIAHVISPTVREEFEPGNLNGSRSPTSSQPAHVSSFSSVDVGDVNVQFPDTLLWKRRSMLLDSQGFLILSPALTAHGTQKEKSAMGAARRFHLSEFKTPAIPDVEMQELPNSVVLDFIEGGGLQVACEDRVGQGRILSVLQDAHRTWAAYGR